MKKHLVLCGVAVIFSASAAMAGAHAKIHHPKGPRPAKPVHSSANEKQFKKIDLNNDNYISPEEYDTFTKAQFHTMDSSGDGKVSVEEFKASRKKGK